jgi:hypothetical protein
MLATQRMLTEEQRVASYVKRMFDMLAGGEKLQRLVDYAYTVFQNPIFVIDAGYRLIAANWEAKLEDPKTKRLLESRYLDPQDMKEINFDNIHKKLMSSDKPILIKNPNYDCDRIAVSIKAGNKEMGHIVVVESERTFHPSDYQLIAALGDVVSQYFQKNEFVRNTKGYNYEYLIADLLDGNIVLGKELKDRLSYVDLHFEDLLYAIVTELGLSRKYINPNHVQNMFEQLMPGSRTLLYNGQIMMLVTRKKENAVQQKELQALREYCVEMDLFCGMSVSFRGIADLRMYYKQALRALELGMVDKRKPSLYRYDDYALRHIVELLSKQETAAAFVHPAIRDLHEYDRKNSAELCHTLYVHLLCERNTAATSEFMHVHRNTLTYRLKKIEGLIDADLDNWKTRLHIIASYPIILELCNSRNAAPASVNAV